MVNVGIVGLGRWGRTLVDSVQGKSDKITFSHGVTRTPANAKDYCAEKGITLLDSYDALMADSSVDAVAIASPHTQHVEQIAKAAAAGKHVFCEKPLTLTVSDAQASAKACADAGVVLALGHNRRFLPATQEMKRMIDAGELGKLIHTEGNFSAPMTNQAGKWRADSAESPGGAMTSLGIHTADAMVYLCGRVRIIDSRSLRMVNEHPVDDVTIMLMGFENGMQGYLGCLGATAYCFQLRVFGTKGWVEMRGHNTLVKNMVGQAPEVIDYPGDDSVHDELEAFADAVSGGKPYLVTPEEAVHSVGILNAIVDSANRGSPCGVRG